MEAYLDSLLYRSPKESAFELVVVGDCDLPTWLREATRLTIQRYEAPGSSGLGLVRTTAEVVRSYLSHRNPDEIRQITQPRWHAPGVIIGATGADVEVCTRASNSLFNEYREAPSPARAWLANNVLGRSIFLSNRVYTPKYGGVSLPWWTRASLVVEERTVNEDRFTPEVEPREGLFTRSEKRVLTVGRVSRRKGIDLLLAVARRMPDVEFTVVGPTGDESLASEIASTPNVNHHSPVEYVEMPGLYTASDIVLSVSRLEWGGVSRAMLEGKAAGRPVIALNRERASSVADTVVSEDPPAIADAIESHLN